MYAISKEQTKTLQYFDTGPHRMEKKLAPEYRNLNKHISKHIKRYIRACNTEKNVEFIENNKKKASSENKYGQW